MEVEQGKGQDASNLRRNKSDYVYTHCYCEENIWKLCESLKKEEAEENKEPTTKWIVFISNDNKTIPIFQKYSHVVWVRHYQLLQHTNSI
jgi:hypothetical protein